MPLERPSAAAVNLCAECGERPPDGPKAQYCSPCRRSRQARRMRHRKGARLKYEWTPELDQVLAEIYGSGMRNRKKAAAAAVGFPGWCCQKRAAWLGLTHPSTKGPDWTEAEVDLIRRHVGRHRIEWIAKRLPGRSLSAVILKCKRLGLSRRYQPGLTMLQTEALIGVDHRQIAQWIEAGRLVARRRTVGEISKAQIEANGYRNAWYIREEDLMRFILEHPEEIPLHRVEQRSFLDLVLRPARELLEIRGTVLR